MPHPKRNRLMWSLIKLVKQKEITEGYLKGKLRLRPRAIEWMDKK